MGSLIITDSSITDINLSPKNIEEEVIQNIWCILSTIKGQVPLNRSFGISKEAVDKPPAIAIMYHKIAIQEAIEKFEKRAEVVGVTFDGEVQDILNGCLKPVVEVRIKDEYLT